MPAWNLECRNCRKRFQHSLIKDPGTDIFPEAKPAFPEGGSPLKCPHCGQTSTYQRHELFYSA